MSAGVFTATTFRCHGCVPARHTAVPSSCVMAALRPGRAGGPRQEGSHVTAMCETTLPVLGRVLLGDVVRGGGLSIWSVSARVRRHDSDL